MKNSSAINKTKDSVEPGISPQSILGKESSSAFNTELLKRRKVSLGSEKEFLQNEKMVEKLAKLHNIGLIATANSFANMDEAEVEIVGTKENLTHFIEEFSRTFGVSPDQFERDESNTNLSISLINANCPNNVFTSPIRVRNNKEYYVHRGVVQQMNSTSFKPSRVNVSSLIYDRTSRSKSRRCKDEDVKKESYVRQKLDIGSSGRNLLAKKYHHDDANIRFNIRTAPGSNPTAIIERISPTTPSSPISHERSSRPLQSSYGTPQILKRSLEIGSHPVQSPPRLIPAKDSSNQGTQQVTFFLKKGSKGGENPSKPQEMLTESKCVRVDIKGDRVFEVRELCNLFTNYGNIELALVSQDLKQAFLYYVSPIGAQYAYRYLNNITILRTHFAVRLLEFDAAHHAQRNLEMVKYFPKKRFSAKGAGVPFQVNPPSRTLHVTYSREQEDRLISDQQILELLSTFGAPLRIKRESSKHCQVNMWFVEFSDEAIAVRVLMTAHYRSFQGGTVRLSFTKTI